MADRLASIHGTEQDRCCSVPNHSRSGHTLSRRRDAAMAETEQGQGQAQCRRQYRDRDRDRDRFGDSGPAGAGTEDSRGRDIQIAGLLRPDKTAEHAA